jgi:3-methyladenine DNA glycosylase AlkD
MKNLETYKHEITTSLITISTEEKATASRRYFPDGIHCIGANATDIKLIISNFYQKNEGLSADEVLCITEYLLKTAHYNEEVLIAFGLINKFVKKHYQDELLVRFNYWLEHYVNNWSQVDDLCIKTIYQFLIARPHLIEKTQHWALSQVSWCRRASNVVWVKFIKRKIGKSVYCLDKKLIFKHCDLLLKDTDDFVQKSVGWLLKVTAIQHEQDVIHYLRKNHTKMTRATIRYAIEKIAIDTRKELLASLK